MRPNSGGVKKIPVSYKCSAYYKRVNHLNYDYLFFSLLGLKFAGSTRIIRVWRCLWHGIWSRTPTTSHQRCREKGIPAKTHLSHESPRGTHIPTKKKHGYHGFGIIQPYNFSFSLILKISTSDLSVVNTVFDVIIFVRIRHWLPCFWGQVQSRHYRMLGLRMRMTVTIRWKECI